MNDRQARFGIGARAWIVPVVAIILQTFAGCSSSRQSDAEGRYPLWKVEGKKNTVYLLGSVHMLPSSAHPFPAAFEKAYDEAENLVFEIKLDTAELMGAMMQLISSAMLPAGQTLEDVLSEETWEMLEPKLDEVAESLIKQVKEMQGSGPPEMAAMSSMLTPDFLKSMLVRMKPWIIGFMLQTAELETGEYKPELGVDMYYMNKAGADEKPIYALESVEEQLALLESLSGGDDDAYIRMMLTSTGASTDMLDDLVDAWKKGDLERLDKLVNASAEMSPEARENLLLKRNRNWIPAIEEYLEDDEDFLVVVGAGHLVGEGSVIDLLRKKGYTVTRQ